MKIFLLYCNYKKLNIFYYIALYDLAGAFAMSVISDKFMAANTEAKISMSGFELLQAGVYTIMITLNNNDNLMKQIIIVR
ncbi:MAG: hypothetical protein FWG85_05415 [Bacteroidetes bacterium]|nr:hypothetical protein [Bacteroidota bacterium]